MKILHIASFNGNIGDHANHQGFRRSLEKYIPDKYDFKNLEIREFYKSWNMKSFDDSFINYANKYDMVVFGGGNYFEMCWDYSSSGTTIDLTVEQLKKIKTPILFNGMGIDDKNGTINKENIKKFQNFLEALINQKSLITVRNDGSKEIAEKYYNNSITKHIYCIPDGGFFIKPEKFNHIEIPLNKKIIAINLAGDAANIRFSKDGFDNRITKTQFINECAKCINELLNNYRDIYIIMTAHIYKDFEIIYQVLNQVEDYYVRKRISVAPYLNGEITNGDYIFDLYRKSDLTIGMRYHANICSIAVNTPTIGIVNFIKHKNLYKDIDMFDRVVESDKLDFGKKLYEKIVISLNRLNEMKYENEQLLLRLNDENEKYFKKIKKFLNN